LAHRTRPRSCRGSAGRRSNEALVVGRRPDAERARFHSRYEFRVGDPTVERIEVITEFRRVVLAVEERVRFGDHLFGM
jgi:hypothetical protein